MSLDWDRIATLKPRLRADAQIHRHCYRGVPWFVLYDATAAKHVRIGEGAWQVVGLMNGTRSLEQIHEALAQAPDATAADRSDITQVLCDLHAAELLECPELNDARQLAARQRRHGRQRWQRLFASPVSQRLPLFDPQSWLDRRMAIARPVFTRAGLGVWLVTILVGLWLGLSHWRAIADGLTLNVLSAHNLLVMLCAYIGVKALHELGHAFAIRAFGGEVHEMGIMFLVFLPVPYVDASASAAFASKSRRIVVGAAGIMVEMLLSVLALAVWIAVEPGLVRDIAFNVLLVAGVSTLLFNGNPLLRFDGYYVLCDSVEIPNLGARSTRYLGYLVQRYLFGAGDAESPVTAPGERRWFIGYGIASAVYRVGILFAIGLFVAERFPTIGFVLCLWLAMAQVLLPVVRGIRGLLGAPALAGRRRRAVALLAVPAALLTLGIATVPVPAWTYAEGIVWLPERAQVRAGTDGFVLRQSAAAGDYIEEGQTVFELDAGAAKARTAVLARRVDEQQARYDAALFHERERLDILQQKLIQARAALADARSRADKLMVTSTSAGTLVVPGARRLQGRYVRQGQVLGYVADTRPQTLRVVVRQSEIDRVRDGTVAVRIKLPGYLARSLTGDIVSAVPSAVHDLPSAALGASGGGRIPVDGSDATGHTPAESLFVLDVALPADAPRVAAGTRAFVRFEHRGASLGAQLARAGRQLLLARLQV